jgi:adenylate cyclase
MLRLRLFVQGEEKVVPLTGDRVRLGRAGDNDIVLPDISVSRNHAELRRSPDGWSVFDLRSTNGVELNKVGVQSAPVHAGDRLGIGIFEVMVEALRPASPPPPPAALPPPSLTGLDETGFGNATIIRPLADFTASYLMAESGLPLPGGAAGPQEEGYARRMLGFLTRLGRVLITADTSDQVLSRAIDLAFEALPVERAFVLIQNDAGELVCELARFQDRVELRPQGEVPVSHTMLQNLMRERVALVTYDALSDQRLSGGESIRLHQIRAAMCAPLWSGDKIAGVIQVDSPLRVGAFEERDLDFLTALANYAAMAVERIRYAEKAEFERGVRHRLERYHSPAVVEEVLREEGVGSRPRAAQATVLFADLVGFTSFSETSGPEEVVDLLDGFLSLAVEAIFAAGGTLDKFIGDCVMAFFGAPMEQADHAQRAVQAAIEIQRGLAEWNARRAAEGRPALVARVGLNSGPVVVGDIGSRRRVDYTVLGNTVNVASRLENYARPGDIVIGPETHRLLNGSVETEPLGEVQLKGLQQRVEAYRISAVDPGGALSAPRES